MSSNDRVVAVFLIETRYQGQPLELDWEVKREVLPPAKEREWGIVYNQVQGHLHSLAERTGFEFLVLFWGLPGDAENYRKFHQLSLF